MKNLFSDFITRYPQYSKFGSNPIAQHVYEVILSDDLNIIRMIDYSEMEKPALGSCVSTIETFCNQYKTDPFNLNDDFAKQCIGMMAKDILEKFGYTNYSQKKIPGYKGPGTFSVASAAVYRLNPEIVADYRIEKIIVKC